ncbi:MAG TPA: hypothetical protein VFG53_13855 [Anaeromyxobacter sp.]|nr:hypothetical protein [Anaeromyxobacter sp.]
MGGRHPRREGLFVVFDASPVSAGAQEATQRAQCICVILTEVREMISRAREAGAAAKASSLAALVAHYEAELQKLSTGPDSVPDTDRTKQPARS